MEKATSYYYVPISFLELIESWRLPKYIDSVLVEYTHFKEITEGTINYVLEGKNVVILGQPGVGKTVALYTIAKKFLNMGFPIGLILYSTKIGHEHEREGTILFLDDAPRYPEILRGIALSGAKYIVVSARV